MRRHLAVLSVLACACGRPAEPAAATIGEVERFEVPVGDVTFHAEIRPTEVVTAPGQGEAVPRAEIRLLRDDGTDVGTVYSGGRRGPVWSGVVPREGIEIEFSNLMAEPGVPAPLNVAVLHVKSSVDSAGKIVFDFKSSAMCIR